MSGVRLIAAERDRQVNEEGWSPEHDDEHDDCALTMAAHAYWCAAVGQVNGICWPDVEANVPNTWPWDDASYKPSPDPVRNLVKAGALIAAEIDRLVRARNVEPPPEPPPAEPTKVVDLMAALEDSLAAAKAAAKGRETN